MTQIGAVCGPNCKYQELYEGSRRTIEQMSKTITSGVEAHENLRSGIVSLLKRIFPRQVRDDERKAQVRLSDSADEVLLSYLETYIMDGGVGKFLEELARELEAAGYNISGATSPREIALRIAGHNTMPTGSAPADTEAPGNPFAVPDEVVVPPPAAGDTDAMLGELFAGFGGGAGSQSSNPFAEPPAPDPQHAPQAGGTVFGLPQPPGAGAESGTLDGLGLEAFLSDSTPTETAHEGAEDTPPTPEAAESAPPSPPAQNTLRDLLGDEFMDSEDSADMDNAAASELHTASGPEDADESDVLEEGIVSIDDLMRDSGLDWDELDDPYAAGLDDAGLDLPDSETTGGAEAENPAGGVEETEPAGDTGSAFGAGREVGWVNTSSSAAAESVKKAGVSEPTKKKSRKPAPARPELAPQTKATPPGVGQTIAEYVASQDMPVFSADLIEQYGDDSVREWLDSVRGGAEPGFFIVAGKHTTQRYGDLVVSEGGEGPWHALAEVLSGQDLYSLGLVLRWKAPQVTELRTTVPPVVLLREKGGNVAVVVRGSASVEALKVTLEELSSVALSEVWVLSDNQAGVAKLQEALGSQTWPFLVLGETVRRYAEGRIDSPTIYRA